MLRRLLALAAPPSRARRGRARPPGDRARDAAARRHRLSRRSFLARASAGRARRLRRLAAGAPSARGGDRRPQRRPAAADPGLGLPRGRRGRPLPARAAGDPAYTQLRPKLALAPRRRSVRRGRAPALASGGSAASRRSTPRARSRCCRRSATTHANQSHFTSRHYWEVGALDPRCGPAGSGATSTGVGRKDNPLQGLSLDGTLAPALATAQNAGRLCLRPRRVRLLQQARLGPGRAADARDDRRRWATSPRTQDCGPRQARGAGRPPAPAAVPFQSQNGQPSTRAPSPTRSRTTRSHNGSLRSPPCSARACRSTASR